jgi:hypothetical protein
MGGEEPPQRQVPSGKMIQLSVEQVAALQAALAEKDELLLKLEVAEVKFNQSERSAAQAARDVSDLAPRSEPCWIAHTNPPVRVMLLGRRRHN